MKSDVMEITGTVIRQTELAVLFSDGIDEEAVWLPKSQIEIYPNDHHAGLTDIILPETLAVEKGLI